MSDSSTHRYKSMNRYWDSIFIFTKKYPTKSKSSAGIGNEIQDSLQTITGCENFSKVEKKGSSQFNSLSLDVRQEKIGIKKSKKRILFKKVRENKKTPYQQSAENLNQAPFYCGIKSDNVESRLQNNHCVEEEEEYCLSCSFGSNPDVDELVEEDFIGDFVFEHDYRERSFVCLKEKDIVAEQNKETQLISELLSLSHSQSYGLLCYFRWNKDRLLTSYFEDPDGVLELAGVKVKERSLSSDLDLHRVNGGNRCSICDNDSGEDLELFAIECNHYFCILCWNRYLSMQILEGQSRLTCPSYDCGFLIEEQFVKKMVAEDIFEKYLSFLAKSFVEGNSQVQFFEICRSVLSLFWFIIVFVFFFSYFYLA